MSENLQRPEAEKGPITRGTASKDSRSTPDNCAPAGPFHSRRAVVRQGVKLEFVAPILSTFFAREAYAGNYSCYPAGHACPGVELCCSGVCNGFNQCDP